MLEKAANIVKGLAVDGVEKAGSGHPGMPVGCAEIGTLLFSEIMKHNPKDPDWPNRDRFILSAGHGSMLLYSLLHLAGYDLSLEDLKNFRQLGYPTPGHPEHGDTPGVETTTGPLGQGFANAVGMAIAEKMQAEKFNRPGLEIIDHYTYTIAGDGCLMEGISSEAASLAGHLGLGKLIAIYDDNEISIEGSTDLAFTEDVAARFRAYDWQVIDDVDGHDIEALKEAIAEAKANQDKPAIILAKTHIAHGAPNKQDSAAAHGAPLGEEEVRGLKQKIGLPPEEKFYISAEVRDFWQDKMTEKEQQYEEWQEKFRNWQQEYPELYNQWQQAQNLQLPETLEARLEELDFEAEIATRKASGKVLPLLADNLPYLCGGSADLAPSNKTYLEGKREIQKGDFAGQNFRFGVREHAMAAIANGLSLYKGLRPFVATFLVFSDYLRPALRLSALMEQPVIYIFTHDSILIGEDGPTHQPVEHLESLRLIPNLKVLRPADAEETVKAWQVALNNTTGPTALVLTRQSVPVLEKAKAPKVTQGGYLLQDSPDPEVILFASGSEVSLAVEVADELASFDISARVISVPDRQEFFQHLEDNDDLLNPASARRVVIEAGVDNGWYKLLGSEDLSFSVEEFGASAPGEEVAEHFGLTAKNIGEEIRENLA